jgi:ABC-type multidrug transport system ATPase subunit
MKISLQNAGKRYNRDWIFRHLTYEFTAQNAYAITGLNGSGKSTLLQVIAGAVLHNEGQVIYTADEKIIEHPHRYLSLAAPYLELVEEMSCLEMLNFHSRFKKLTKDPLEILELVSLEKSTAKQIRYFSSGMKQRLKLAMAFFSDSPVILLDEPVTNLDKDGIQLYQDLIKYSGGKLVIVSSNDEQEYHFCNHTINIADYK